jgi:hypothetical protein
MEFVGARRVLVVEDNANVVSAVVLILVHQAPFGPEELLRLL